MANPSDRSTGDAFEDVAFLVRSENRVQILETIAGGPHDRRDLVAATDVSSATVGRVLTELQSRGWAERTRDGYVATPAGARVTAEFDPFIGAIEAIQHLGDAVDWLPFGELDIGLHRFRDVTVRRPADTDPAEVVDFFIDLLREVSTFRALTHLIPVEAKERTMVDGVRGGRLSVDLVITAGLLEYLCEHPDHRARWTELLDAGATASRYDSRVPCNLFVLGDTVILGDSHSDSGHPYAFLLSEDTVIRSWAHDVIDRYRADAEPIDAHTLAAANAGRNDDRTERDRRTID